MEQTFKPVAFKGTCFLPFPALCLMGTERQVFDQCHLVPVTIIRCG